MADRTASEKNSRFGLKLFFIYFAFYCGFVLLNAFRPEIMETLPFAGLNLAIIYGFGLILGAFLLSMVYGLFSSAAEPNAGPNGSNHKAKSSPTPSQESRT